MACRLRVLMLGVAALSSTACYRNHTADEDEVIIGVPGYDAATAPVLPVEDAGSAPPVAPVADASVDCRSVTDPIQQLLCAAMQAGGTGNTGGINVEDILGGLLGGGLGRVDGGTGTGGQISIEDILGGLLDGAGAARDGGVGGGLGGLVGSTTCNNPTDAFAQLLCGLLNGSRDGGTGGTTTPADPVGSLLGALTDAQCSSATEGLTQIICFLRDVTAPRDGGVQRRDGGFTLPRPGDASVPDAALPTPDAAVVVDDAGEPNSSELDGSVVDGSAVDSSELDGSAVDSSVVDSATSVDAEDAAASPDGAASDADAGT